MAFDLADHLYFETWTDPQSGVDSFLLEERVAPLQKGLYYATPSIGGNGQWLWFYGGFPPSRQWMLAAVSLDPARPDIRLFPAAAASGNPLLIPEGDAAYVPVHDGICLQPIHGKITEVLRMPKEILQNRHLFQLVTDLTRSADGKHFVLDSRIGSRWLISLAEIATGTVTPLRWFSRCHHHAMFSPIDPDLILVGQGPWHDPVTGDKGEMDIRMWLMDTAMKRYEPVLPDLWFNHNCMSCHEWWAPDGMVCWCDYNEGVYECDLSQRTKQLVWSHPLCHAHCDPTKRYYCGDENPYHRTPERPCRVLFFDRQTGQEIAIASNMALPPLSPDAWRSYHLDPHPHFSADGEYVVYTTTVRGNVDVAVTPVRGILSKLRSP